MLQQIKECWPGPGPNKVRLPGGRYIKPGLALWCKLHDAHGAWIAEDGQGAARVLLDYQTPADLVPASSGADSARQAGELAALLGDGVQRTGSVIPVAAEHTTEPGPCRTALESPSAPAPLHGVQDEKWNGCAFRTAPGAGLDQQWQEKYNRHLWFQFTPAQLAAWYNERHQVADILPPEKNGMGLASWRGEHTASVGLREDGWIDFGVSVRRADGKQDGGDALELTVRVNDEPKPAVMRELARQLVSEAREAVESAAHCGEQPPPWVQAFMSQAGWDHYHQLRKEAGYRDQAITEPTPHIGGIVSCSSPDHDTPASQTHPVQEQQQGQHQLQDSVQAVSSSNPMQVLALLEAIKDYGQAHAWAALLIDGEEVIPVGRSNWLQFVWLSQQKDQQRRVYEYIRGRSQP